MYSSFILSSLIVTIILFTGRRSLSEAHTQLLDSSVNRESSQTIYQWTSMCNTINRVTSVQDLKDRLSYVKVLVR